MATMNNKMHCVVMNRWTDEFAAYDRYIDHAIHDVAYIVTPAAAGMLEGRGARHVVTVPDFKDEATLSAAVDACKAILGRIDRLICLSEYDLTMAATLRRRHGIEGYTPEEVARFRDKTIMKSSVLAAGLRAPRFVALNRDAATLAALRTLRFPLILKPRAGAASMGVHRLDDVAELDDRVRRIDLDDYECEEFIEGPIFHVDGLVSAGRVVFKMASRYVGNCLAFAGGEPLGSIMLPRGDLRERLFAFAESCLLALDLHQGAFHLEIIEGSEGLYFLEVGARVGGAEIPFTTKEVYGVDLIDAWVRQQLDPAHVIDTQSEAMDRELAGWLIIPEPVGMRLLDVTIPDDIASMYASITPPVGHVFDGQGGYETILGRFRYRGISANQIEADIHATLRSFSYGLERHTSSPPEEMQAA